MKVNIDNLYDRFEETKKLKIEYYSMFLSINESFKYNSIVDVGCRLGYLISQCESIGKDVLGLDYFTWMRDNSPKNIREFFLIQDLRDEFQHNKKYDIVISTEVGEHIDKNFSTNYLNNIKNLCNKNGNVIMSWSNHKDRRGQHLNPLSNIEFEQLMEDHGFFKKDELTSLFQENCIKNKVQKYYLENNLSVWGI